MSAQDPAAVTTEAMLSLLKRRRMLFEFMVGTVDAASAGDLGSVQVVMDGDTVPITAESLIGDVVAGQRVPILYVPPNGYMIIGHVTDPGYARMQAGQALFSFTGQASANQAIVFATPFDVAPVVTATIDNTGGATNLWFVRVGLITTTGFTMVVSAAAVNTWTAVPVGWMATVPTQ